MKNALMSDTNVEESRNEAFAAQLIMELPNTYEIDSLIGKLNESLYVFKKSED